MANDLELDLLEEIDRDPPEEDLDHELDEITLNCMVPLQKIGRAIKHGTAVTLTEEDISFLKLTTIGGFCLMSLDTNYRRH